MARISDDEPCPCGSGNTFSDCHGKKLKQEPIIAEHFPLKVIPEPDPGSRAVFEFTGSGTVIFNLGGTVSLDCGSCGSSLAIVPSPNQITGAVLKCAKCNAFNDT
jgi:SEC-C motif-containing protein